MVRVGGESGSIGGMRRDVERNARAGNGTPAALVTVYRELSAQQTPAAAGIAPGTSHWQHLPAIGWRRAKSVANPEDTLMPWSDNRPRRAALSWTSRPATDAGAFALNRGGYRNILLRAARREAPRSR